MIVTDSANCYKDLRVSKLEGKVGQKEIKSQAASFGGG
jgi:hypothetical protein